jgi:hypothetical protein
MIQLAGMTRGQASVTGVCSWAARHTNRLTKFDGNLRAGVGDVLWGRDGGSREGSEGNLRLTDGSRLLIPMRKLEPAALSSSARLAFGYQVGDKLWDRGQALRVAP